MRFKRRKRREAAGWVLAAGVVLTGAAAAYAVSRLLKAQPVVRRREMRGIEKRVLQALLNDAASRNESIDIAAVSGGVIELSGVVDSPEIARRIVSLVDGVAGVHTVLNRLEIRSVEARLQRSRKRTDGESTRWYGGSVGMGRRRQGAETGPRQRDDHASLLARSLTPNRDDALADAEESEASDASIRIANNNGFRTHDPAHSPDPSEERTGRPPEVAPHDMAQRD